MPIAPEFSAEFQKRFATWVRLEPRCRNENFARGLQARSADPLWMLARQWQVGEFIGEDAGSPLQVLIQHSSQSLDTLKFVDGDNQPLPEMPLEVVVEAESASLDWRTRVQIGQQFERILQSRVSADAQLDPLALVQAYRDQYLLKKPADQEWLEIDAVTRRYIEFMAGRVSDGKLILNKINNAGLDRLAAMPQDLLDQISDDFNQWYAQLCYQPPADQPTAWRNQQLEYSFELNAATQADPALNKTHLVAPDYRNGSLDWYSFYANSSQTGEWQQQAAEKKLPTLVTVGGTSPRWWAFEDSATDFGKLDVTRPDLAKLLLMEFVLIYGDDWFSVPLPGAMSSLQRIDEMKVLNVFGDEPVIEPVRQKIMQSIIDDGGDPDDPLLRWETYALTKSEALQWEYQEIRQQLSAGGLTAQQVIDIQTRIDEIRAIGDVLFIPPVAGFREESKAIEEVRFIRDEGANMVWGIENIVKNGVAQAISGFDAQLERATRYRDAEIGQLHISLQMLLQQLDDNSLSDEQRESLEQQAGSIRRKIAALRDGARPTPQAAPQYQLATHVPENWVPFIPTSARPFFNLDHKTIRLRRAQMLRNAGAQQATAISAMTRLLEMKQNPLLWLEESAVPRSGLRVQLNNQRIRWVDGKTYVWKGRKVTAGKGEGSSGLKFDVMDK